MFIIKFTTTYNGKLLYYTVSDGAKLIDVSKDALLQKIEYIDNATKEDILIEDIIGYHVALSGKCNEFNRNSIRSVIYGYNDLDTWCRKNNMLYLLEEYNDALPATLVSYGQLYNAKWKCSKCSNEYNAIIKNRTYRGDGCKKCSKQGDSFPQRYIYEMCHTQYDNVIYKYRFDISDTRREIDIYIPEINLGIEYNGAFHNSEQSIIRDKKKYNDITSSGLNMLYIIESDINNIDYANRIIYYNRQKDRILKNLSDLITEYFNKSYNVKLHPVDYHKVLGEYKSSPLEKSLLSEFPNIASTWDYERNFTTPDCIAPMSTTYAYFKCPKCNISLNRKILTVTQRGDKIRCPICNGKKVITGINDLKTLDKEIMKFWDYDKNNKIGIYPDKISRTSHTEVHWICNECNISWKMSIASMQHRKYCKCGRIIHINGRKTKSDTL
jgi:hypothetical protein